MSQDEIIEMARQVGFSQTEGLFRTLYICSPSDLKAFAKLVAAKEREACLSIAESMSLSDANMSKTWRTGCRDVAEAIRAIGEA